MVWSIVGLTLLLFGVISLLGAVFLWSTNKNVLSTVLFVVGGGLLLFAAPASFPHESPNIFFGAVSSVAQFLYKWRWIILGLIAVLLIIDGILSCIDKYRVDHYGLPHHAPGTGVQWHHVLFCFIGAAVILVTIGFDAYNTYGTVHAQDKFFELQEVVKDAEGIDVILEVGKPVAVTQEKSALSNEEARRFKDALQEKFKSQEKEDLVVEEIHFVQSRSFDGETIDSILIGFSGTIDKADPEEDVELANKTYPLEVDLDEEDTKGWLTDLIARYQLTTPVSAAKTSPKKSKSASKTNTPSKTVITPPLPSRLGDMK